MAVITMKQLLEAGVHFGHHTRRWNPKMKEYIYGERNGVYIIDLQKTADLIEAAYAKMVEVVRVLRRGQEHRRRLCCGRHFRLSPPADCRYHRFR